MRSPFKFLDAYTIQDKNVFFGRDTEIEDLYTLIFKTNLLIVYGLSGTGKTSVIQCGLANRFDGPDWYPMFIRRNDDLNDSISGALQAVLGDDARGDLVHDVSYLIRRTLRPVYLILDQFEELFILGTEDERQTFVSNLRKLLDAGLNAKIILIMREEYIGQMYPFEQVIPELFDHRFRIEPMGTAKVKTVILDSFDKFNITLEEPGEETLQRMITMISDPRTGIALPYLQVYLDMLYRYVYRKEYGTKDVGELPALKVTRADIESLGRIGNVLERFLRQQASELNTLLRTEFQGFPARGVELILDPFATDDGTKRPVHYTRSGDTLELDDTVAKTLPKLPAGSLSRAIELLDQARILRVREDTIELAHDSLAAVVDRNRTDEQRQIQDLRRRLANAYEEFQKTGVYLNARQLAAFEEHIEKLQLTEEQIGFIHKSEEAIQRAQDDERVRLQQEREAQQQKKLARTRGILLSLVTLFAAGSVLLGFRAQTNSNKFQAASEELDARNKSLTEEYNKTIHQQDSTTGILVQVAQQLGRMDSVINGHFSNPDLEILKSYVTLKSLVVDDTLSDDEILKRYASARVFETTSERPNGQNLDYDTVFSVGQDVYAWAVVLTPRSKELLVGKWFGSDGKIIGSPAYVMVADDRGRPVETYVSTRFAIPGRYTVKLYNSAGKEIGSKRFQVDETSVKTTFVKDGNFVTCYSVDNGRPVRESSTFRAPATVWFWARVHCPVDADVVILQVLKGGEEVFRKEFDIGLNMSDGYAIRDAKGFRETGTYTARLVNRDGLELKSKTFVMN